MNRVRLGLLVPSSNTTMESEYRHVLPERVSLHVGRMRLREVTVEALMEMEESLEEETVKLADAQVNIIGYGCTSGSLVKGLHHDQAIVSRMESATGIQAVATSGAVLEALRTLESGRVAVATPYIEEINGLEKKFLEMNGFEIVDIRGLGIVNNTEIGMTKSESVMDLVRGLNHEDSTVIFISCTNLPTLSIIRNLEEEFQKPVVSSNTATLWSMLRRCGFKEELHGYGRLFSRDLNP